MGTDTVNDAQDPRSPRQEFVRSTLGFIFFHQQGLRAGWRLVLYLAIAFSLNFAAGTAGSLFLDFSRGASSLSVLYFAEVSGFATAFGAALLMARFERRPAGAFGLPRSAAFGKKFWLGMFLGLCEIGALLGLTALFGGYSFGPLLLGASTLFGWGIFWMVFFVFVGLYEEFLFRGYTQFTLAHGIGFWPAAILLSVVFGAAHLRNPGENWLGASAVVITGLVFAFALRRTGNLWLAVGWHAGFDFGETFLFSVPNSGAVLPGHLSASSLRGPEWLTGGSVGPEASVFAFFILALAALVIHLLYPARVCKPE